MADGLRDLLAGTTHTASWHARLRGADEATLDAVRDALRIRRCWPAGWRLRQLAPAVVAALDAWEAAHGTLQPGQVWSPPADDAAAVEGEDDRPDGAEPAADGALDEGFVADVRAAADDLAEREGVDEARAFAGRHGVAWEPRAAVVEDVPPDPWAVLDAAELDRVRAILRGWRGVLPDYAEHLRPSGIDVPWPGGATMMAELRSVLRDAGLPATRVVDPARVAVAWLDAGRSGVP